MAGKGGIEESNKRTEIKQQQDLSKYIQGLAKEGQLDPKTAADMQSRLQGGTESIIGVQARLRKMFPNGFNLNPKRKPNDGRLEAEHESLETDIERKGMTPEQRLAFDQKRWQVLQSQMMAFKATGRDVSQMLVESDKVGLQIQQDILDQKQQQTKESEKQNEKQKILNDLQQQKTSLGIQFSADAQKQSEQFGSVAQIAQFGWTFSPRGGWQRTDAGSMAHELETLEGGNGHMGWQTWNRLHGNIDLANQQASRESYLKRTLGDMGYLPKDEKWEELNNHMNNLNQKIADVTSGKTLAVTIEDVTDTK
jgi:hypothetical protein